MEIPRGFIGFVWGRALHFAESHISALMTDAAVANGPHPALVAHNQLLVALPLRAFDKLTIHT
jgi:hypothetical protein